MEKMNTRVWLRQAPPHTLYRKLLVHLDVWRSRRALSRLDLRALEDIGVTPEEAKREAGLGIWDVPVNWRGR